MTSQFIVAHPIQPVQIFTNAVCETVISTRFLDILTSIYIFVSTRTLFAT